MPPQPSRPISATWPSEHLTLGAGVAIFHLATSRVVLCYHTRDEYWFLPKGRKNADEDLARAAEREGFEESGFRNRLLPLPVRHRQPVEDGDGGGEFVRESVWVQAEPVSRRSQYLLFWYVAETVPPEVERGYRGGGAGGYRPPEPFPREGTLKGRIEEDVVVGRGGEKVIYEPVRHEGTGVDEEEALYTSRLMSVEEACGRLRGSIMEDVVRRGWDGIQERLRIEAARARLE
ncbi:hypothetical protein M409DRAFT_17563 [Zasmidium cellare ATCC 36951]|uniref:Nudix hydrolase domain-containing protein n=1 Tax=Zasmidium cellare ATCC 36951 TaxID=1080233 RepID=A0A6A6CYN5_ZASCE|nr:uncharacterized protein M409DRAFT_17563 [Zasmidium cellare ATCC 36951]KAF2172327.1 hypothetical protein M409DRAFT_17563 [Zasmidium cellare ATCC 36951]